MRFLFLFGLLFTTSGAVAQTQKAIDVADFVVADEPVIVLNHVRVVDGTGAAASEDQAVVVANGKIQSIGPATAAEIPQGAQLLDRAAAGEEIVIARAGRPVARLVALSEASSRRRTPGGWRGKVRISDDFDELPGDLEAAFRGERL